MSGGMSEDCECWGTYTCPNHSDWFLRVRREALEDDAP